MNTDKKREVWSTKIGFIFAAAGSAVGLGNMWKFPYVTGMHGGGAFVLVYLLSVIVIGFPIMVAEFMIGRNARQSPVGAFAKLGGTRWWKLVGWLGVASGFIIISYYSVVGGWILDYVVKSILNQFQGSSVSQIEGMFDGILKNPVRQVGYHALFISLAIYIVKGGVSRGIERWNKILMPALFGILLLLVINSLLCPGAKEGIKFLFYPDFSKITPAAVLEAMGQAFFSLSLGMGAMITYGSYLGRKADLMNAAVEVCILDTMVALIGGLVIFPIVFSYGLPPSAGPGLFFKTLPVVFSKLPWGGLIAFLFFLLVTFAAITSAISLLEVVVSYFIDEMNWSRKKASLLTGITIFIFGIPSALSFNILSNLALLGEKNVFDSLDFVATNYMLPIGGLLIAVFCGWFLPKKETTDQPGNNGKNFYFYRGWLLVLKYITPVAVSIILLQKAGLINF